MIRRWERSGKKKAARGTKDVKDLRDTRDTRDAKRGMVDSHLKA